MHVFGVLNARIGVLNARIGWSVIPLIWDSLLACLRAELWLRLYAGISTCTLFILILNS